MVHWPARTKWNSIDYLKSVAGYRTVPVEVNGGGKEAGVRTSDLMRTPNIHATWAMGVLQKLFHTLERLNDIKTGKVENVLQVGKNYLCSEWKQELITFSQFIERIKSNDCRSAGPTYLAQHPLFDQA
ncbi:[histone H3]-dimethyl-L-lysine(36) demethylase [Sarracenia purpurea var. burkii]